MTSRKTNKPLIEKRRRARINECLQQLKEIIVKEKQLDNARCNRLEKADILEMTVDYIRQLSSPDNKPSFLQNAYELGVQRCMREMTDFLRTQRGHLDASVTQNLTSHCRKLLHRDQHMEDVVQRLAGNKRAIKSKMETFADSSTSPKRQKENDNDSESSIIDNKETMNFENASSGRKPSPEIVSSTELSLIAFNVSDSKDLASEHASFTHGSNTQVSTTQIQEDKGGNIGLKNRTIPAVVSGKIAADSSEWHSSSKDAENNGKSLISTSFSFQQNVSPIRTELHNQPANINSGLANQASGLANQTSESVNQNSGLANQTSGSTNQTSGPINQTSGPSNQSSGSAILMCSGSIFLVADGSSLLPHILFPAVLTTQNIVPTIQVSATTCKQHTRAATVAQTATSPSLASSNGYLPVCNDTKHLQNFNHDTTSPQNLSHDTIRPENPSHDTIPPQNLSHHTISLQNSTMDRSLITASQCSDSSVSSSENELSESQQNPIALPHQPLWQKHYLILPPPFQEIHSEQPGQEIHSEQTVQEIHSEQPVQEIHSEQPPRLSTTNNSSCHNHYVPCTDSNFVPDITSPCNSAVPNQILTERSQVSEYHQTISNQVSEHHPDITSQMSESSPDISDQIFGHCQDTSDQESELIQDTVNQKQQLHQKTLILTSELYENTTNLRHELTQKTTTHVSDHLKPLHRRSSFIFRKSDASSPSSQPNNEIHKSEKSRPELPIESHKIMAVSEQNMTRITNTCGSLPKIGRLRFWNHDNDRDQYENQHLVNYCLVTDRVPGCSNESPAISDIFRESPDTEDILSQGTKKPSMIWNSEVRTKSPVSKNSQRTASAHSFSAHRNEYDAFRAEHDSFTTEAERLTIRAETEHNGFTTKAKGLVPRAETEHDVLRTKNFALIAETKKSVLTEDTDITFQRQRRENCNLECYQVLDLSPGAQPHTTIPTIGRDVNNNCIFYTSRGDCDMGTLTADCRDDRVIRLDGNVLQCKDNKNFSSETYVTRSGYTYTNASMLATSSYVADAKGDDIVWRPW